MSDQIKMFIAGEEVVSQNEFTINEEMLSASSTILNNCYPKSWELTKDYISNFYYPKDYSRFVLAQGEYLHGNNEFEPLEITGKNLFNDNNYNLINAYYVDSTGKIVYGNNNHLTWLKLKPNTTYTLTQTVVSNVTRRIALFSSEPVANLQGTLVGTFTGTTPINQTFTTTDTNIYVAWVFCNLANLNNHTENEMLASVQLELGNQATTYESYYQPNLSYETNVEKEINTFNIYGRTYQATILPSGYTQVDYIESNGMQYIDTGFNGGNNYKITCKIKDFQKASFPFSDYKNGTANENIGLYVNVAGAYAIYHTSTNTVFQQLYNEIKEMSFTLSSTGLSYQINNLTGTLSYTPTTNNGNIILFRRGNSATYYSSTQLYNFKIYNSSNVLVRDFIPCYRNSDNEVGLYDLVNNVFYTNLGSGSFTYGSIVNIPNPNYPSELVSVGYENLLNIQTIVKGRLDNGVLGYASNTTNLTLNNDNFSFTTNANYRGATSDYVQVNTGNYIFNSEALNNTYSFLVACYDENKNWLNNASVSVVATETKRAFTINANVKYIRMYFSLNTAGTITINKPQLEKGNTVSSFIPYGKYGIEMVNTGKNLFNTNNISNIICSIGNDGTISMSGNTSSNGYCTTNRKLIELCPTLKVGETYYIYATNTDNKNYIYSSSLGYWTNGSSKTITQQMLNDNVIIYGGYNTTTTMKIMITKSLDTSYEPYKSNIQLYVLDEPLRRIGGYQDRLYVDNGVLFVERKIGSVILNGSESWNKHGSNNFYPSSNLLPDAVVPEQSTSPVQILCNYFKVDTYQNVWAGGVDLAITLANDNTNNPRISYDAIANANDFETWLSTHNTQVQYVLATTTITPIGYIDLPSSYEGQNNVSIYTGLDTRIELWYYWKNYDVLFAGVVKNSGDISLNPRHPHYCSLQILDYKTFLSESNTLDFVIADKTIKEAINMVINAVSGYGFIVGNIDIDSANDVIGAYSTLNKTAYDVLQYLAEISGSRWRARVVDSLTMAIDFYDPDTLPQAEDLEYTQEYFEDNNIVDLTFNYGTRDYRNKQILLSDEVYANINYDETLISNGYSNTFTLQNNIGDIVSVVVDGAEKTIGTNNDKQMGVEADFYFTPGKNVVESNSVYSAGTMIHLTYQPLVKGRQIVYNNSEVDRISQQTQTDGVIARYETRNDVLSSDELEKIAKTYIEYKGKAEVILTLKTQNKDLYDIGEVVYFNAPISDLAQNYMVKSKKIEYVVINKIINLFYVYEMTSSFNSEKAINYFDNQRSKATGNIEEGESITRNVDIETQASIIWSEGSVSSATVTVTGDNILNCALNSPFVE